MPEALGNTLARPEVGWPWVKIQIVPPVNIPIPTKIWVVHLPQNGTIGFDPQPDVNHRTITGVCGTYSRVLERGDQVEVSSLRRLTESKQIAKGKLRDLETVSLCYENKAKSKTVLVFLVCRF